MVTKKLKTRETSSRWLTGLLIVYYVLEGIILWFVPLSLRPKKDVKNKIVLITGAGSGLGRLMALRFAELESRLVLWDISQKGLDETCQLVKNLNSKIICKCYVIDLSKKEQIYETAKAVQNDIGSVDILINNAGIVSGKLFLDTPDESIEATFKINVLAHFYMLKCFLPDMVKRNSGHIVTIASIAGLCGNGYLVDYCASKFANVGMDWSLRMELANCGLDGIKTTIVKPFFIKTGMFDGARPGIFALLEPEDTVDKIMLSILTNQEDVALPGYIGCLLAIQTLLPSRAWTTVYDFIGGYEMMSLFSGRQKKD